MSAAKVENVFHIIEDRILDNPLTDTAPVRLSSTPGLILTAHLPSTNTYLALNVSTLTTVELARRLRFAADMIEHADYTVDEGIRYLFGGNFPQPARVEKPETLDLIDRLHEYTES